MLILPFYFFRFINFTATATIPPAARSGRMPVSGATGGGGPHDKPGSSNKSAVISLSYFMISSACY
jgi:hypothetical protein